MSAEKVLASKQTSAKVARLTKQSKLFKTAIKAIQDKKGEHIISLDLRKIPEAVADFFLICEASSSTQVKAIGDAIQQEIKHECGEMAHRQEGYQSAKWVLVDYVNIVIHIMQPETRKFYQLEEMWSDAPAQHHDD